MKNVFGKWVTVCINQRWFKVLNANTFKSLIENIVVFKLCDYKSLALCYLGYEIALTLSITVICDLE